MVGTCIRIAILRHHDVILQCIARGRGEGALFGTFGKALTNLRRLPAFTNAANHRQQMIILLMTRSNFGRPQEKVLALSFAPRFSAVMIIAMSPNGFQAHR